MSAPPPRAYEIILLGATGYTGRYTAEHVVTHLPTDLRWAIAGRNGAKLERVAKELRGLNPDRSEPGVEVVDVLGGGEELEAVVRKAAVVVVRCLHSNDPGCFFPLLS
jgi:short subunit dehydrogenase-like uncharacterized protein